MWTGPYPFFTKQWDLLYLKCKRRIYWIPNMARPLFKCSRRKWRWISACYLTYVVTHLAHTYHTYTLSLSRLLKCPLSQQLAYNVYGELPLDKIEELRNSNKVSYIRNMQSSKVHSTLRELQETTKCTFSPPPPQKTSFYATELTLSLLLFF